MVFSRPSVGERDEQCLPLIDDRAVPASWSNSYLEGINGCGNQLDEGVRAPSKVAEGQEDASTTATRESAPGISMASIPMFNDRTEVATEGRPLRCKRRPQHLDDYFA
ncbi:hypothetical protein M514_10536 [Trichuris suis]|uniref:Uncharacterized protein n=1 Tax=Trichuris suis TaxID=68888 RepID=A0A085N3E6_9BILA|nr:hypothetical protein M513_10536 [Trichuris suis]KFD63992.1 hypothetical protein M514_10536 [Trichuris suis]